MVKHGKPGSASNPQPDTNGDRPNVVKPRVAQARYWILTIPFDSWQCPTELPPGVAYIKGQQEIGSSAVDGSVGYHHWQLVAVYTKPTRLPESRLFLEHGVIVNLPDQARS